MTEREFVDQLDEWALGSLSEDGRAAMEAFLAANPQHRDAARRAFSAAAALGQALPPSPPPPGSWGRIAAALPPRARVDVVAPRRSAWAAVGWVVAAAAALIAVWLWNDRRDRRAHEAALEGQLTAARQRTDEAVLASRALEQCAHDLEVLRGRDALAGEAVALLELAGTQLIPLEAPTPPAEAIAANAIYHRGVKKAYVMVKGLPADADGYQIWVNRAGQRLPAGALAAGADGSVIASVMASTLDDVPESFEVTRASGEVVLRSRVPI